MTGSVYVFAEVSAGRWEVWNRDAKTKHVSYGTRAHVEKQVAKLEAHWAEHGRDILGGSWRDKRPNSTFGRGRPRKTATPEPVEPAELAVDDVRRFLPASPPAAPEKKPPFVALVDDEPASSTNLVHQNEVEEPEMPAPRSDLTNRELATYEELAVKGVDPTPTLVAETLGEPVTPVSRIIRKAIKRDMVEPVAPEEVTVGRPLSKETIAVEEFYIAHAREHGKPPPRRAIAVALKLDPRDRGVQDRIRNIINRGKMSGRLPRRDGAVRAAPSRPRQSTTPAMLAIGATPTHTAPVAKAVTALRAAREDLLRQLDAVNSALAALDAGRAA